MLATPEIFFKRINGVGLLLHTLKSQLVVNRSNKKIICVHITTLGRMHDRKLLRVSKVRLQAKTKAGVDSGYQGLQHDHPNTAKPIKNTKRHPLTREQKKANRAQARERILVENVIGSIKRFRILSERYRSRRRRFGLRINLIAAIYNMQLEYAP